MPKHLEREISRLKTQLLGLSALVEDSLRDAVAALERRDERLAAAAIASDDKIDAAEVELEEECLKILAMHQPVANDLRFIVAVLKINNDLERIGDLAGNIAERAIFLARAARVDIPFDFTTMASRVKDMLRKSLDALVNLDCALARQVLVADDEVDGLHRGMYEVVKRGILECPEHLNQMIHYLIVSRSLERIGDSSTNIAEDVIYMIEGEIVRHHHGPDLPENRAPARVGP